MEKKWEVVLDSKSLEETTYARITNGKYTLYADPETKDESFLEDVARILNHREEIISFLRYTKHILQLWDILKPSSKYVTRLRNEADEILIKLTYVKPL